MTSERPVATVLDDVRRALGHTTSTAPEPLPPFIETHVPSNEAEIADRFVTELTALGARVHGTSQSRVADEVAEICRAVPAAELALSSSPYLAELDLERRLASCGFGVFPADSASPHAEMVSRLANCSAGITGVDYAIAETGTLVLSSDGGNSLLVSLLPPVHIAIVRVQQISGGLDEVISKLSVERLGRNEPTRSVSFITGPSRTSDVELTLSIGVHGPKELHVILVED